MANKSNKWDKNFGKFGYADGTAMEIVEMTTRLSGAIFKKAELDNNFEKVYTRVVEKMAQFELLGDSENILEIFGQTGG